MRKLLAALLTLFGSMCSGKVSEEWMTIIVHGTVGFQANVSLKTIVQVKKDMIEGTDYERNVLAIREHPYLFALQPIQKIGLQPIEKTGNQLSASYAFALLFQKMQKQCGIEEKGSYYTFGWTGLISEKRRYEDARYFYVSIRNKIKELKKKGKNIKVRLIGYSHGASMLLNLADIRADEFPSDTFTIEETYLVGIPVTLIAHEQIKSPIFKKVYNIYSRGDKVQRLDIFSPCDFLSHREFKGLLPDGLTQIEMRYTARLRPNPCFCLPPRMRGIINQSPGHIELWFFGWAPSSYRKNLSMFPVPGAVFIPHLVCAARKIHCKHAIVDIRADQCITCIRSREGLERTTMPFMNTYEYADFLKEAMTFHPSNPEYQESFERLQSSIDTESYK